MSTASSSSFSLLYISVLLLVLIHSSIQEGGIMLENPNNTENIRKWKIDVLSLVLEEMKQPVMKQSTDLPSFAKKEKKQSVNKRK
ncbi:hypothetical protein KSF78_0008977 [Schistosoma japonicum]|nr:hypothetical protein KSF78_0008977 [Schistosoma japonicum]